MMDLSTFSADKVSNGKISRIRLDGLAADGALPIDPIRVFHELPQTCDLFPVWVPNWLVPGLGQVLHVFDPEDELKQLGIAAHPFEIEVLQQKPLFSWWQVL